MSIPRAEDEGFRWAEQLLGGRECEIRVGTRHMQAKAKIVESSERKEAWEKISTSWPIFLEYEKSAQRVLPLILLMPAGPAKND